MAETVQSDYQAVDAPGVHWQIPYSRLDDATPTVSNPAQVLGILPGAEVCGTILSVDANASQATVDFSAGAIYYQQVRNVLTYNPGVAELTWGPINIGDPVYYDGSASMPVGVYLSTSPLNTGGTANPIFGRVVARHDADSALYPKGGVTASTQYCAVMHRGAGA